MMEKSDLRHLLRRAVDTLPVDLSTVLILRYGLGNGGRQSIGKISKQLKIKGSGVARMETKAIRNLRKPDLCRPLFQALDAMDLFIWHEIAEEISDAGSLMRKSESYDMAMRRLPGEISLAIKCRYGGLGKWLECNAAEAEDNWFRSKHPPETVKEKVQQLAVIWNQNRSPLLVNRLLSKLRVDVAFLRFLLSLSPWTAGFYGGYAAARPISSPELRAIRLHLLFLHKYPESPLPLDQIAENYNALYHDDQLNAHLAENIMRSRPHLFLETRARTWSGLGSAGEHAPFAKTDDVVPDDTGVRSEAKKEKPPFVYERPWSETTTSDIVREILEEKGLCQRQGIIREFLNRTDGRYQAVNAEVDLALNKDVVEAAPRVYGLRKDCGGIRPMDSWTDVLLTRSACKIFVIARYAGEPLSSFPLWTPAMEQQWCFWAEGNSELNLGIGFGGDSDRAFNRKLFQSLLFVSEPEHWPASDSVKTQWLFKKQGLSEYRHARPVPQPIWRRIPSLQDLFSVAVTSKRIGYANWITTSHALMLGRHSPYAAGALGLLIALEIILPADNWQQKHEIGPRMDSALSVMEKEIKKKGFVHWMDETGIHFKDRLRESIKRIDLGWVSADWIREFLDILEGTKPSKPAEQNLNTVPIS